MYQISWLTHKKKVLLPKYIPLFTNYLLLKKVKTHCQSILLSNCPYLL